MKRLPLLFLSFLLAASAAAQDSPPSAVRVGTTLPASCTITKQLYHLTQVDGANAAGLYRCNGSTYASIGSSISFSSPTTGRLAKFASSTSLSNSLLSDDGTNTTLTTGALRGPDGTAGAPTFSFSNDSNTGFYWRGVDGLLTFSSNGTAAWEANANLFRVGSLATIGWGSTDATATMDVVLTRDAANTLAIRNSTNAQTFRVYNTYTDASNYERGYARWTSSVFELGNEGAGTGSNRSTRIFGTGITFKTNFGDVWNINGSGHILANTDNTYDIGASATTRPRSGYFGSSVVVAGASQITSNGIILASGASYYFTNRAGIFSPADGVLLLQNWAGTDFSRLQFGGTSTSFPALKRSGTSLQARLADDSALTNFDAATFNSVKVYRALLTQTGTSAPTATVLENALGGTLVWTRSSTGLYVGTLAGVFTAGKTHVNFNPGIQVGFAGGSARQDGDTVYVRTFATDLATGADDVLSSASIEIRVYP